MPRNRQNLYAPERGENQQDFERTAEAVADLDHAMETAVAHEVWYPAQIRERLAAVREYIERAEHAAWTRPTQSLDWIDVFVLQPFEEAIRQEARLGARLARWVRERGARQ